MSLIDNLTFKCMNINRGDVSFNLDKDTYFHKDYSLLATDFLFLMTEHGVHPVESDIVQTQQKLLLQPLVYLL